MDPRKVKCLVWDLDNTLWTGTLLEGDAGAVPAEVLRTIRTLDERGILQSVASRGDRQAALARLEELGLAEYFLHPQVDWGSKAASLEAIREALNLGPEAMAFVDDQPYELAEVRHAAPEVLCLPASSLPGLLDMPEFVPEFVTEDSRRRRELYRLDARRQEAQREFVGPADGFLAGLGMVLTLAPASQEDLQRAEELTVRTHQLNTTGRTYGYAELDELRRSPDHLLLMADLEDRFGPYGRIGLALVERGPEAWRIRLLLMSCRVMGRGVGTVVLHRLMRGAAERGLPIRADFRPTERNGMMRTTLLFAGFREIAREGDLATLEARPSRVPDPPAWLTLRDRLP